VNIRAFENLGKFVTVISGSATLTMAGTIVAEFIAASAGIGYSIRVALYQSDLANILTALFVIGIRSPRKKPWIQRRSWSPAYPSLVKCLAGCFSA